MFYSPVLPDHKGRELRAQKNRLLESRERRLVFLRGLYLLRFLCACQFIFVIDVPEMDIYLKLWNYLNKQLGQS